MPPYIHAAKAGGFTAATVKQKTRSQSSGSSLSVLLKMGDSKLLFLQATVSVQFLFIG